MFNSNYGNDSGMPTASQFGAAGGFMPRLVPLSLCVPVGVARALLWRT